MAQNAQQEPHEPWFFTSVTLSYDLQSKVVGDKNNPAMFEAKDDKGTFNV